MKTKLLAIAAVVVVAVVIGSAVLVLAPSQGKTNENTLVVAISSDVNNWYLDKFADGDARFVWAQVFGTLVRLDGDLNLAPGLASSWHTENNGTVWVFNLTTGVKFHDGSDFNADAVVFSYGNSTYVKNYGVLARVNYVEKVDDHTVRFIMKAPMGALPYYLTHIAWPVMSPNMAGPDGKWNGKIIGTGPFEFQSQTTDQQVVLIRNENYTGVVPALEKVVFKVIKDPSTRKLALKAGDVDMVLKVSENDVADLNATNGIDVQSRLSTFTDFLQFNTKADAHNASVSPFTDARVRQAVAWAVDSEGIVESLLSGQGEAARGRPVSPVMMYNKPDLDLYTKDLSRSNQLMEQAGWVKQADGFYYKNGTKFTTTLLMTTEDAWASRFSEMSDAIAAMLREAGMDVQVEKVPTSLFNSKESSGDFGMILRTGYFTWGPYPRHFFIHDSVGLWSHYNNATYDQKVRSADATSNLALQAQLYEELQDWVVEELPAFYLVHECKIVAYRENVKGYQMSAEDPWLNLEGVTVVR